MNVIAYMGVFDIDYFDRRKVENLSNTYKANEFTRDRWHNDVLNKHNVNDENRSEYLPYMDLYELGDFVDACNDQVIDLDNVWLREFYTID